MKYLSIVICLLVAGCVSSKFAMQPGDQVVFQDEFRADDFRDFSGNDINNYGDEVVTIDQPTFFIAPSAY